MAKDKESKVGAILSLVSAVTGFFAAIFGSRNSGKENKQTESHESSTKEP